MQARPLLAQCTSLLGRHSRGYSAKSEPQRHKHIAFIGLGRMGFEMAFNLFSKTLASTNEAGFVVCDAVPASTQSFTDTFLAKFPGAQVRIVGTPGEYVDKLETPLIISEIYAGPFWRLGLSSLCYRRLLRSRPCIRKQVVYFRLSNPCPALWLRKVC